ncbi:hypothetical protein AMTR_s00164p00077360 [Amborella trichopoda]|uniref:Uncharacterized protein n=1 Tax=Amborella trichopoda TaxID=13333 RepID=W1PLN5_AMBTC|nr:hypothetical protein AMTR_s00164p00077360 [Amborella trichopoda]
MATHGTGKNQFFSNIPEQTQLSGQDSGDLTGSDYEWGSSPDEVLCVDRKVSRMADHLER